MKPMVILYNPQSNASGKKILPMSLLAVGAVLEYKYKYTIVDGNLDRFPLTRLRELISAGAHVLGVTVMPGPQLAQAVRLCRALKGEFPQLTIVWGGYFPSQHADACLSDRCVDFVIRGHGELAFVELLNALAQDADFCGLPGLAYRDERGHIVQNLLAPLPHPERLPAFPYHRIDIQPYIRRTFLGSRTLAHHSSYGCPFFCNFCAVVNMVSGHWVAQSAAQVADVAQMYRTNWDIDAIEFYDNNFFTYEARVAEFAERVRGLGMGWWGEARIDTLLKYSDRTWQLLRDSGLKMVFMGAESGSPETLGRMEKGGTMSPDKTLEIAAKMSAYRILPEFSFMLGNPPDPAHDVETTIAFVRRVKQVNPQSEIVLYNYTPVPLAGDLYDRARASGFRFPETLDEWTSDTWLDFSQRYSDVMPWMDPALRQRIRNFERVLNAYYPTTTDVRLKGAASALLRGLSAWRYHLQFYEFPVELRVLQKFMAYQRPETAGF